MWCCLFTHAVFRFFSKKNMLFPFNENDERLESSCESLILDWKCKLWMYVHSFSIRKNYCYSVLNCFEKIKDQFSLFEPSSTKSAVWKHQTRQFLNFETWKLMLVLMAFLSPRKFYVLLQNFDNNFPSNLYLFLRHFFLQVKKPKLWMFKNKLILHNDSFDSAIINFCISCFNGIGLDIWHLTFPRKLKYVISFINV